MAVIAQDTFTRADNSTTMGVTEVGGFTWLKYGSQTWGIESNVAYPVAGIADRPTYIDVGVSDNVIYQVKQTVKSSSGQIHYRIDSDGNGFRILSDVVSKGTGGSWSQIGTISSVSGDVIRIELVGSEHKIFVNGVLSTTINDTAYQTATKFGFAATGASSARFDDVLIQNMSEPDTSTLATFSNRSPANNAVITASSQTISAVVSDADGDTNDVFLQLSKTQDFATLTHDLSVANIASGGTASFSVTGLLQGNYYWRMRAKKTGTTTYTSYTVYRGLFVNISASGRLAPDAILTLTNGTGTLANIQDDPDTPNADYITASGNADIIVHTSFPQTPNLQTGAGLQNFRVLVRKSASTSTTGSAIISLYENGVQLAQSTFSIGSGNTATVHQLSWNASLLSAVNGSNVEVHIRGVGVYSGGGSGRFTVQVGAVEWNYQGVAETQVLAPSEVVDTTPPAEVTSLSETHGFTTATLTWVKPVDTDFSHVRILRNGVQIATNQTGTSYADSGLANGTQYTYLLKTVDVTGNQSAGVSIVLTTDIPDTTAPSEVTNLLEMHTVDTVTLTWTNPADADFSHVRLLRNGSQIATNITAETYADSGLSPSTQYTYLLKTVDAIGNESTGVSIVANTTAPPAETPPLPTLLVATRSKLSDEISKDVTNLTISFDKDVAEWTVNVLGSDPFTGTVADSGGAILAGAEITAVIDWTELYQEGQNRINVYGKTATGVWTPYGSGSVIDGGVFIGETFSRTINGGVYEGETFTRSFDGDVDKIKFRRGLKADLPILEEGEMALCTDTKEIYIGSDEGNVLLN